MSILHRLTKVRAPEFPKGMTWLNSKSLKLADLKGKVVLIDFWTFSCVNCQRTLPHVTRWHRTYKDLGLVIIGVHSPEFAFEKDEDNVKIAVTEAGIEYPVVLDPDFAIWKLYANKYWPQKYLVNRSGYIVYDHAGEGDYAQTEMEIQKALSELGPVDLPAIGPDDSVGGSVCYRTTPETYLGYLRGRIGNMAEILPDVEEAFTDKGEHHDDVPYLHGHFKVGAEYVEHSRALPSANEYLSLKYSAFSVNLVMGTSDSKTAVLEIELDGKPLPKDMAGADVRVMKDGRAEIIIKDARMYQLVSAKVYHRGTLKLKTGSGNLRMYAFTFGGCVE
ncbi:MAG: redoxin domain-containing protein [Patescibacteria group bacterium]|jgi:thiol-disulfide isomerase/thioredoxin